MKNSWIFPGQASQKIGMGKDLYDKTEIGGIAGNGTTTARWMD